MVYPVLYLDPLHASILLLPSQQSLHARTRQNAHHPVHRLTGWSCSVYALLVKVEIDIFSVDFAEEVNEVPQGAAKAIYRPGHDHVKFPANNRVTSGNRRRGVVC